MITVTNGGGAGSYQAVARLTTTRMVEGLRCTAEARSCAHLALMGTVLCLGTQPPRRNALATLLHNAVFLE